MLATLAGSLALLLGLSLLLLPLVVNELSRPRDSAWGAVVLLLGLVLVTSAERLTGAPMLAVLCGGLLVGRLGGEVAQGRWRVLSDEERLALRSAERWSRSLNQLAAVAASLLQSSLDLVAACLAWWTERRQGRSHGKRWVRAEGPQSSAESSSSGREASSAVSGVEASGPGPGQGQEEPAGSPQTEADAQGVTPTTDSDDPMPGSAQVMPEGQEGSPEAAMADLPQPDQTAPVSPEPGVQVVADFTGVDSLLAAAVEPAEPAAGECPPAAQG